MTTLHPLRIRKTLGRRDWQAPVPHGPDGWLLRAQDHTASVIVSAADIEDGGPVWVHASIARRDRMPDYDDLVLLHRAVWGDGWAYQVFAPPARHINIHPYALHLWGRADGSQALPDFGCWGTV